jgi:hypothetical protein
VESSGETTKSFGRDEVGLVKKRDIYTRNSQGVAVRKCYLH